jgi:hypothetical protein
MDLTSTQPVKPLLTTGNEDTETIGSIEKFVLREGKIAELRKTSKAQKVNGQDPFAVRCQCDWKGQEEDMVCKELLAIETVLSPVDYVQFLPYTTTPTLLRLCGCV